MNLQTKIGLGTVQFGIDYGVSNDKGKTPPEEVKKILEFALEQGIDTIDTAFAYGDAEKVLGENSLNEFRVISKFMPPEKEETIDFQLKKSLQRLKQESLYGYLAHRPLEVYNNPFQWEELKGFKEKGLIKKIGFSFNEPSELALLLKAGFIPDLIQIPYNIFDNRFENYFPMLKSLGTEIHTRSAFLQGIFFMDSDKLHPHFDEIIPFLRQLNSAFDSPASKAGFLLKHCLSNKDIDKVIIGINTLEQLMNNIQSLKLNGNSFNFTDDLKISDKILIPSNWPNN